MTRNTHNKVHMTYLCYVALFLLFVVRGSQAHPMLQSQVEAKVVDNYWLLTLKLPNNRLEAALKKTPTEARLTSYVLAHVNASSPANNALLWRKNVTLVVQPDDHQYWRVEMQLLPPAGANLDSINIDYQVITEKIITHKVLFWLMPEAASHVDTQQPKLLGTLRGNRTTISIKRR